MARNSGLFLLNELSSNQTRIRRDNGVIYSALVPNEQGMERALAAKVNKVAHFTAASETFCRKNVNSSIDDTFERLDAVVSLVSSSPCRRVQLVPHWRGRERLALQRRLAADRWPFWPPAEWGQ